MKRNPFLVGLACISGAIVTVVALFISGVVLENMAVVIISGVLLLLNGVCFGYVLRKFCEFREFLSAQKDMSKMLGDILENIKKDKDPFVEFDKEEENE